MNIEDLKRDLNGLTLKALDQIDLLDENGFKDGVEVYTTTDNYTKDNNDMMIVAAVNNDINNFVLITSGLILLPEDAKKLDKEVDVSQIFLNRTKAEMLLKSIIHAFPDALEMIENEANEELENQTIDEENNNDNNLKLDSKHFDIIFEDVENIDQAIGCLKKKLYELECLKQDGFDKVIESHQTCITVTKDKIKEELDNDQIIDTYLKNKEYAQSLLKNGNIEVYKQDEKVIYAGIDNKDIQLIESNAMEIVKQGINDIPPKFTTKLIKLDKVLATKLIKVLTDKSKKEKVIGK